MAMEREYPEGPDTISVYPTSTSPRNLSGYQTPLRVLGERSQQTPYSYYHREESIAAAPSNPAGSLVEPTRHQVHQVLREPNQLEPSDRQEHFTAVPDEPTRHSGPSQSQRPQAQPPTSRPLVAEASPASPLGLGAAFASQFLQQRWSQPIPFNQETPELRDVGTFQRHGYHVATMWAANAHIVSGGLEGRYAGAHSEAGVRSGLPHAHAPDAPQPGPRQLVERIPEKIDR
jgi:hypothetical protein